MINPASVMKLMSAKNKFQSTHPKFVAFVKTIISQGVNEGDIIEVTITKEGCEPITSNMRIQQSDLDLFNELKGMM